MFSSLPDYCRFAESALPGLRKDHERETSNRLGGMVLNVVLLAGLWGVPLYARWIVLSDRNSTESAAEAIIGKWWCGETMYLEFTPNQQLRLINNKSIIESADYQIAGDVLQLFGFKLQPGDRDLELNEQCYRVSIGGARLTVTPADIGFTPMLPEDRHHAPWTRSNLLRVLPQWHGAIVHFQRADWR